MPDSESQLARVIGELKVSIDQLRVELVRKDVYESDQKRVDLQLKVIERDVIEVQETVEENEKARKSDKDANRRMIFTAVGAPTFILVLQLFLTYQVGR